MYLSWLGLWLSWWLFDDEDMQFELEILNICDKIIQITALYAGSTFYFPRKVYLGYEKACWCCIGALLLEDQFSLSP